MKLLLVLTFAALALCGEIDDLDSKKRGATKTLNAIQSNEHQKAEQYSYLYQQQPSSSQQLSPVHSEQNKLASSYYSTLPTQFTGNNVYPSVASNAETQTVYSNLPNPYNIVAHQPPYYPVQYLTQTPLQSKVQLVPAKLVNGQIQIISQPSLSTPQIHSAQQTALQLNAVHQSSGNPQYSTSQSSPIPAQASYALSPNGGYMNQVTSPFYPHQSSVGQMLILTQPVPQLYNNYLNQSPLYSNAGQQLLQYYQSNPHARYQLLNSGGTPNSNTNYNNYQQQSAESEYEKPLPGPITQNLENDVSVNEYISPSESNNYKLANTYSTREQVYKTS